MTAVMKLLAESYSNRSGEFRRGHNKGVKALWVMSHIAGASCRECSWCKTSEFAGVLCFSSAKC